MKKGSLSTIILVMVFLVGLSLLLYPVISDYWNSLHQSYAITQYAEQVANLDTAIYDEMLEAAKQHNEALRKKENRYRITEDDETAYNALLNLSGNGIMGYIEVPAIGCTTPIYHGVSDSVLQIAVGHIEWSSLPIGGIGTHSVISGHRGLPSARLFTDLDKMVVGDTFVIRILDETMTYEVDQILIVLPDEIEALDIDPDADYCTLVTCTPYGINSHRMLVRGHRIENEEIAKVVRVTADALLIDPILVTPLIATPILLLLLVWLFISTGKKKQ